jgi:hypothetical protein
MRKCPVEVGDEVVHQSHPGRFTVVEVEQRPSMNVYSNILTIRSRDGVEMRVLDTTVRKLDKPALQDAKESASED